MKFSIFLFFTTCVYKYPTLHKYDVMQGQFLSSLTGLNSVFILQG